MTHTLRNAGPWDVVHYVFPYIDSEASNDFRQTCLFFFGPFAYMNQTQSPN